MSPVKIVSIVGPTATGKSRLAVEWAERFGAEIISTDSMQVYSDFDLGLAKPSPTHQRRVRHHFVGVRSPRLPYSAGEFEREAEGVLSASATRRWIAVGGCGLYERALLYGLDPLPSSSPERLAAIEREHDGDLHAALAKRDPRAAARIHPNDQYRIRRALLILRSGAAPLAVGESTRSLKRPTLRIGCRDERDIIYKKIHERIDRMIEAGLLAEVERLASRSLEDSVPGKSIGYRYFFAYNRGAVSFREAVRLTKQESRRYAKRQFTWFQREEEVDWFFPDERERITEKIERFFDGE